MKKLKGDFDPISFFESTKIVRTDKGHDKGTAERSRAERLFAKTISRLKY